MNQTTAVDDLLGQIQASLGFVPNMMKELGKNPAVLEAYLEAQEALRAGSFRPKEKQVIQLAAVAYFHCAYCMAAHGTTLGKFKASPDDIQTIRAGGIPADPELAKLVRATRLILQKQGALDREDLEALEADGIDRPRLYEIIALIGLKIMTAWVDHIAHLPIDPQYGG